MEFLSNYCNNNNNDEITNFHSFFNDLRKEIKTNKSFFQIIGIFKLANPKLYHLFLEELENRIKENQDLKFMTETIYFANSFIKQEDLNIFANSTRLAGGDILKLYRTCNDGDLLREKVNLLRRTELLRGLVALVYGDNHPKSLIKEKIYLLALAAFYDGNETTLNNGIETLTRLYKLLEKITSMSQLQTHLGEMLELVQVPVCATGVVVWLRAKLFNEEFYEWTAMSIHEPAAFHVIDEIGIELPCLRDMCFGIWIMLFEREFEMLDSRTAPMVVVQYREKFLDHFVTLFENCYEVEILNYLSSKVDDTDPMFMIYFLNKVIPNLEMKIDQEIYILMLKMLSKAPSQLLSSSANIQRLLAYGNHVELSEEGQELHLKLEQLAAM